jgi:hypothetical protein
MPLKKNNPLMGKSWFIKGKGLAKKTANKTLCLAM